LALGGLGDLLGQALLARASEYVDAVAIGGQLMGDMPPEIGGVALVSPAGAGLNQNIGVRVVGGERRGCGRIWK
jgi:hypothetical protein